VDVKVTRPFPRMSYDTAMERYGSDKPHLGFDLAWKRMNLPAGAEEKLHIMQPFKALRVPGWASASRSQLDKLQDQAKSSGADWFAYAKLDDAGVHSPLAKIIGEEALRSLTASAEARAGDLVIFLGLKSGKADRATLNRVDNASGDLRLEVGRKLELLKPGTWSFLWVIDFPMFEYDEKEKRYGAMHHPFTSPREEDLDKLESDPNGVKALAYDLVLNGAEIGGGSIRIHRQDIQKRIFTALGLTQEKARERFGFFLDALESGTPPHGGIALGFDRIVALMAGESNIREVIAFPKTASAVDMMCDAPATVDLEQLDELGLEIKKPS
jgi:aspartyl-tRNA synthetase